MVFKVGKFSAEKVFKDCALTLGLVVGSFVAGPFIFILIKNLRGETDLSVVQNQRLIFLSLGILAASYIATHAKFKIGRLSAFILMVSAPILITLFWLMSYSPGINIWLMLSPAIIWFFARNARTDYLSALPAVFKKAFSKKSVRVFISLYIGWLILLVITNNFEFLNVLSFDYYNFETFRFLAALPGILTVVCGTLYMWCKRGR